MSRWFLLSVFLCLIVSSRPNEAAEATCLESPSTICLGKLAAQNATTLRHSKFWRAITQDLLLAGQVDDAKALAVNLSRPSDKCFFEEDAAVVEIAFNATSNASHSVSLEPIFRLEHCVITKDRTVSRYDRMAKSYRMLALVLLGEQPYLRGGQPWLVEAEKVHAERSRPTSNNALRQVLKVWPEIIGRTSDWRRRGHWIDYANTLSLAREFGEARRVLKSLQRRPTKVAPWSSSLVSAWCKAGDPGSALAEAKREKDVSRRAKDLAQIASTFRSLGRIEEALRSIDMGFAALEGKRTLVDANAYAMLLEELHRAGDKAGSNRRAERLARISARPHTLFPFRLARAAAIFNDLKKYNRARSLLQKALSEFPPSKTIVGFGFHYGPVRYDGDGLADGAIQKIAVELYRSGDKARAIELIRQLGQPYKFRASTAIVRYQIRDPDAQFNPETLAAAIDPEDTGRLLLVAAATKVTLGEIEDAKVLIGRALKEWPPSEAAFGRELVRIAVLLDDPTLLRRSLGLTLKYTLGIRNAETRTMHIALLAAWAKQVLIRQ